MSQRILLVEDEPGLLMTLTDRLQSEGYTVETAADGEVGLRRATDEQFDLVILDVMLPRRNGFDVCRDLRQRGSTTPIIMLTARGQVVDKVVGLEDRRGRLCDEAVRDDGTARAHRGVVAPRARAEN